MVNVTRTIASVVVFALALPLPAAASDDDTKDAPDFDLAAGNAQPAPEAERAWSVGPYVRYLVVPAFMMELFVDLAPSVSDPAFGVTARYRPKAEGPMFDFGIGYASYAFEGAFRSKG